MSAVIVEQIWDRKSVPPAAVSLIQRCEGLRLVAYRDSGRGVWTIGNGSTHMMSGRAVQAGDRITPAIAADLLAEQCEVWAANLSKALTVPIPVCMAVALMSFEHNLGGGALDGSTMAAMANAGRFTLAQNQLNGWAIAGGEVELGGLRRREYERRIAAGAVTECQVAHDAVWVMQEPALMPLYQRAFSEATAWGWKAPQPSKAVHAGTPVGKPVPIASRAQSADDAETDALNAAQLTGRP